MEKTDIEAIILSTPHYNLHSHTQFCDGRADMSTMAAAACAAGMEHWGFSPHSPVPIESSCNMASAQVDDYIAEGLRLRELYRGRMNIYIGMEIDYLGPDWGPAHDYFRRMPLDYRIGSVHFVDSPDGLIDVDGSPESFIRKMKLHFSGDIRRVVNAFYDRMTAMVEEGGFDIVGHLDKIGYNAECYSPGITQEAWYIKRVEDLVDLIASKGLIAELNTKALATANRLFPEERYLRRLISRGVTVAVNSDAHFPDRVDAGRPEGLALVAAVRNHKSD